MEMKDLKHLTEVDIRRIQGKTEELKKLYELSDAEMEILTQVQTLVRVMFPTLSPATHVKIMRGLSAINDMIMDEMKIQESRKKINE